jgi:predicted dehydrogenase
MNRQDGMNYAPQGKPVPVVKSGEFIFFFFFISHGHIYGMCNGLTEAGGTLKSFYDPDPDKMHEFSKHYPDVIPAKYEGEILDDKEVNLIAAADIPNLRGPLGLRVMAAAKDYFTDKCPFTTLEQLSQARDMAAKTGQKYSIYYSERLHTEAGVYAGELVKQGVIGKIIQVIGLGPHRLNAPARPDWFFIKEKYGGILCDIASHQMEQILFYTGAKDAKIVSSHVANYNNPQYPELEDFGEAHLVLDNNATAYFRVDWFTPNGLQTWGDGRVFILGTEGFIELRKFMNLGIPNSGGSHIFLANGKEELYINVEGKVGYPFFGQLILDCINRTENAMTQEHAFKAAELALTAQKDAVRLS